MENLNGEGAHVSNASNNDEHVKETPDDEGLGVALKSMGTGDEKIMNEQSMEEDALTGGGTGKETNESKGKEQLGVEDGMNDEVKVQEDMKDQETYEDDLDVEEGDKLTMEDDEKILNEQSMEEDALTGGGSGKETNESKGKEQLAVEDGMNDEVKVQEDMEDQETYADDLDVEESDEPTMEDDENEEENSFDFEEYEDSEEDFEEDIVYDDSEEDIEEDLDEEALGEGFAEYELGSAEDPGEQQVNGEDTLVEEINEDSVHVAEEHSQELVNEELLIGNVMNNKVKNNDDKCEEKCTGKVNKFMKRKKTEMNLGNIRQAVNKDAVTEGVKSHEDKKDADPKQLVKNEKKMPESTENIAQPRKRRKQALVRGTDKQDAKVSDSKGAKDEINTSKEKGTGLKAVVKNEEKNAAILKGKTRKVRRAKGKMILTAPKEVPVRDVDNPELAEEKRMKTKGMIFMCSSKTKNDCYRYRVLGLPDSKRDMVLKIYRGMRLFLYDFDLKLMYGIYKAAEPGGYNIEPKAFKSAFPSQVRFKVLKDCLPIPEEKFKAAIRDNYYSKNKFDCQLNAAQVHKLCKLFQAASLHHSSKPSQGTPRRKHMSKSSQGAPSRHRMSKPSQNAARGDTYALQSRHRSKRQSRGRERDHVPAGYRERHSERFMHEREAIAMHEREAVAPRVAHPSLHVLPPLPPATVLPPVYDPYDAYGRTMERDSYRHVYYDRHYPELDVRRRQEDIEYYDPYPVRRAHPASRESLHSLGHQSAYSNADPLHEYYARNLQPDSHPYRSLYRY